MVQTQTQRIRVSMAGMRSHSKACWQSRCGDFTRSCSITMMNTSTSTSRNRTEGGKRMSKTIRYVDCAHCGETVGTYYVTCPYCGYRLVDAKQTVMDGLTW